MNDIDTLIKGYRDELTQWWILTEAPEAEKREALEMQAILWHQQAQVTAAYAEVCLSILELPPILLPEAPLVDTSLGPDRQT